MDRRAYLLVGLIGLFVGAAEYVLHYRGLVFPDALDYAQMAREVASGRPFETLIARPHTVVSVAHESFVDVSRPPLHPLLLGGWFALTGSGELQAAAFSALFWLGAGLALYAAARAFLDSAPAAAATMLFFLSTRFLPYVWSGMSEAPFILLLVLAFWQLSSPPDGRSHALAGGLLIGGACLVRGIGVLALPWALVLGWAVCARAGRARIALVAGVVVPAVAWVLCRSLTGAPAPLSFNLAQLSMFTASYPRYSMFRMAGAVDPVAFVLNNPGEVVDKFVSGVRVYLVGALRLLPIPATVAWLAGLAIPRYGPRLLPVRRAVLGLVGTHVLVLPFYEPTPRFLLPLIPFLLLIGAAELWGAAPQKARAPALVVWVGLCLVGLHTWVRLPGHCPERFTHAEREALVTSVGGASVVLTDAPWRTAWELRLKSVWIPQDEVTLRKVEQMLGNVGGFVLTSALPAMDSSERPALWLEVWQGARWPKGYHRMGARVPDNTVVGLRTPAESAR